MIWDEYGDANGDLRKMADFFGVPLENQILMIANDHCKKILVNCCKPYEYKADMPLQAAVKIEKNVLSAMEAIQKYCRGHDIEESNIAHARFCEKLLEEIDSVCRTVDGVVYKTREIAEAIKNDKTLFQNFLRDKNIYEDGILDAAGKLDFQSKYYKHHLPDIVKREAGLRDASKICFNLKETMYKYFPDGKTQLGDIEFAKVEEGLEQKEGYIRKKTKMPDDEIPIMLISYETSGKSGILLTNAELRIFTKGLLLSENKRVAYKEINSIISLGGNNYRVETDNEPVCFAIKAGMDNKCQYILCDFLNEAIHILKNLKESELAYLKWISEGSIRCICGGLIPAGKKMCPSCFKIYTEDGVFLDTIPCKFCGNRVLPGKKFCTKCGNSLADSESRTVETEKEAMEIGEKQNAAGERKISLEEEKQVQECMFCGSRIKEGKKFCSKCGRPVITADTEKISCPQCGNFINKGKKFCNKCGTQIE